MSEEKQNKDVKKKNHKVRNIIIIVIFLIIVLLIGTYILHTQSLLPEGLENGLEAMFEPLDNLFGIENKEDNENEEPDEKEPDEKPLYNVITELDKKYDNKEVEIIDIYNEMTATFTTYPEEIRNNVSIISVDDKKGLINTETGEVVVEPEYDFLYSDILENGDQYIIGSYIEKKDQYKINLKTFETEKYEVIYGHGGGGENYYDPTTKKIYYWEYEPAELQVSRDLITKNKKGTGGTLDVCTEFKFNGENSTVEENPKKGYFDLKNNSIVIEPEYDKATLFDNGIAAVAKENKAYFINEENEKIYDIEFEDAANIHGNRAWVKEQGKWKLIEFNKPEEPEEQNEKETSYEEWQKIYKEFILNDGLQESEIIWTEKDPCISFVDIDNDNTPELIYYDGTEPGPRGIKLYMCYTIKKEKVIEYEDADLCTQGNGIFYQIGYNKKTNEYAFITESFGTSATTVANISTSSKGVETHETEITGEKIYSLEDDGYEIKNIEIKETDILNSYTEKQKEKAINKAFENYLPNEELYK